jgi:hypothetical protein
MLFLPFFLFCFVLFFVSFTRPLFVKGTSKCAFYCCAVTSIVFPPRCNSFSGCWFFVCCLFLPAVLVKSPSPLSVVCVFLLFFREAFLRRTHPSAFNCSLASLILPLHLSLSLSSLSLSSLYLSSGCLHLSRLPARAHREGPLPLVFAVPFF